MSLSSCTDETFPYRYTAKLAERIERDWQTRWEQQGVFYASNPVGDLASPTETPLPPNKLFIQDMFPYPSGDGLHVGHPLGYIATDVYARYWRMQGYNVLHTLGFDAFGLPAEQYAIATGTHPRQRTEDNIAHFQRQLHRLGLGHDSRRTLATTDTDFYRWTQWIFREIYNAWFDPDQQKARPISELIDQFATGTRPVDSGQHWDDLSPTQQNHLIDQYRLVYRAEALVNWCPGLGTVLANEEVTAEGKSERGNFPVFRKHLRQWMMRITAYADRLLDDLDLLDWPEKVKTMQRNWIGRSRGASILFSPLTPTPIEDIEVFTTRPDTLFGATYLVLAPEHPLVDQLIACQWPTGTNHHWTGNHPTPREAVTHYRKSIAAKSDLERQENKDKTGVFLGTYALNPATNNSIPIFIADYVLAGYGTGAIMAVPGHDQRDWEFASLFELPIIEVIHGGDLTTGAYLGEGTVINSAFLNGLSVDQAKKAMSEYLVTINRGHPRVEYKLRDWLFARQRYWGEPFPIVYDHHDHPHILPQSALPVELPDIADYSPALCDPDDPDSVPSPPLAKATQWVTVELDLGQGVQTYWRDTNVMPQWAGSSWYELRYIDPHNPHQFCAPENEAYWMGPKPDKHGPTDPGGVDLYVGGVEHAVLHLLYSRFWHKVLFDLGHVSSSEPYRRLVNQGYIQAYAYTDSRGAYVPADQVIEHDGRFFIDTPHGRQEVYREFGKMGKSLKNSISPDQICTQYGADTLRVYEMAMGPLEISRPWTTKDVIGSYRFLQRVWRLIIDEHSGEVHLSHHPLDQPTLHILHHTIAGVNDDYRHLRNNTAIAKLIEYTNYLTKTYRHAVPYDAVEPLILMLAPVAPHISEELWMRLGHDQCLTHEPFPQADPQYLQIETKTYPVQINGKKRALLQLPADVDNHTLETAALADEKVKGLLGDTTPRKIIIVPGKLVNIVV